MHGPTANELTVKASLSTAAGLELVRELLAEGGYSRTSLAHELCDRLGLLDRKGKSRVGSCLTALRDLEQAGEFDLPARDLDINKSWKPRRQGAAVPDPQGIPGVVDEVRGLRVELVDPKDGAGMRTWNELMIREHPWGEGRLVGRQLRYLVRSEHGVLGAVGFAASALKLEARERWIGWSDSERRTNLDRVVNLSRLLVRPSVSCKNLASWILARCTRRLAQDFSQRYGFEPWLLETFVDEEQHPGTCFRAANWERIGQTKGRGRNDREGLGERSTKGIYMYPLVGNFRERMGVVALHAQGRSSLHEFWHRRPGGVAFRSSACLGVERRNGI